LFKHLNYSTWIVKGLIKPEVNYTNVDLREIEKILFIDELAKKYHSYSEWYTTKYHHKLQAGPDHRVYHFINRNTQVTLDEYGRYTNYDLVIFDEQSFITKTIHLPEMTNFIASRVEFSPASPNIFITAVDHLNRTTTYSRSIFTYNIEKNKITNILHIHRNEYEEFYLKQNDSTVYVLKSKVGLNQRKTEKLFKRNLLHEHEDIEIFNFNNYYDENTLKNMYFNTNVIEHLGSELLSVLSVYYIDHGDYLERRNGLFSVDLNNIEPADMLITDVSFIGDVSSRLYFVVDKVSLNYYLYDSFQKKSININQNIELSVDETIFSSVVVNNKNTILLLSHNLKNKTVNVYAVMMK
ncbi:MAG: hypothetical protein KDD58_09165, partial [Bdellovibrionales bacterium]|nr:hypothetical protein [Bdellovibrionales bacterium]